MGGQKGRPFQEIVSGGLLSRVLLGLALASVALIGTWGSVQWLPSWADQLTGGKLQHAKALTQLLLAAGAVAGCLMGALIGGRLGRRPAYFLLCLCSLAVCGYLFRVIHDYGPVFLLLVFLAGATTAAFYGWLPLYLPELFPTRVRATGQGFCYNFGRVLAALGAVQMGQLMSYYQGSYARAGAAITLIYGLGMVLIWFGPETKGQPLPE